MPVDFEQYRNRLFSLSYHITGSAADAEDLVQECYLRYHQQDEKQVENPEAYLVRVQTNLCLDHLKSARVRRESYVGPWLPEPLITTEETPELQHEQYQLFAFSLMTVMQTLTPVQRCCWCLNEIMGHSHAEIAEILNISESNSRQQLTRARAKLSTAKQHTSQSSPISKVLLENLLLSLASGDSEKLVSYLAEEVQLYADGGGKAVCATRPIFGIRAISRYLTGISKRYPLSAPPQTTWLNHEPGILFFQDGRIETAMLITSLHSKIQQIYMIRNPDKLLTLNKFNLNNSNLARK